MTSPPYWGLRTYGQDHNEDVLKEWLAEGHDQIDVPSYDWYREHGGCLGLEPLPEWFVGHLAEFFQRLAPALKPGGSMWINVGDIYFARWSSIRMDGRQGLGDNHGCAAGLPWEVTGRRSNCSSSLPASPSPCRNAAGSCGTI